MVESAVRVVSGVLVLLGIALIVIAAARGSGAILYVVGALFVVLGVGRLALSGRDRS
jgi:hypothetical protein